MANILTPCPGLFLLLLVFSSAPLLISSTRSHQNASVECHPNDLAALLEFKAAFPPDAFPTWDTMVSCCAWSGVLCRSAAPHRVFSLSITNQISVRGSIPPAIGNIEFLEVIRLHGLINLVGYIPRELTNLKNLRTLIIDNTSISTPIPSFIEEIPLLKQLTLSGNNHWGPIPESIFHNRTGSHAIQSLDLSNNQLSGPIPPSFGNIDFHWLNLSRNWLTGDASFLFGQSKTTSLIDLSRNQLDFELTDVVFPQIHLVGLRLNNNHIQGIIPPQIANVSSLRILDLSHNNLCGIIPTGGVMRLFGPSSYANNICPTPCLCGTPLPPCTCGIGLLHAFSA